MSLQTRLVLETLFQKMLQPGGGHLCMSQVGRRRWFKAESEPCNGPAPPLITALQTLGWSLNLAKSQFF